jgi:hypothetical protein
MAKKKKKTAQPRLTDKAYLKSGNARKLPIFDCRIPEDWSELGKFPIFVSRQHSNGNVTIATLLIDIFCTGVKEAHYWFNMSIEDYEYLIARYEEEADLQIINADYSLVHNIIYEAIEYASEYGIAPHPDFNLVKMILEEDSEEIPLMEIPLGKNGKPLLLLSEDNPNNNFYIQQLEKHAGAGNYEVLFDDEFNDDGEDYNKWDSQEWKAFIIEIAPEDIYFEDSIIDEIFYKCAYLPTMSGKQLAAGNDVEKSKVKITYDVPNHINYSKSEMTFAERIYLQIMRDDISRSQLKKILSQLKIGISQWPENPILLNYLTIVYDKLGEEELQNEVLQKITEKFPDYFFGKIALGKKFLDNNDLDAFEHNFNDRFDLQGAFPTRTEFHVDEFIAFNTLFGMYFIQKNDVYSAFQYKTMIMEMVQDEQQESRLNMDFFLDLRLKMVSEVTRLIFEAQSDQSKLDEMALLLSSTY